MELIQSHPKTTKDAHRSIVTRLPREVWRNCALSNPSVSCRMRKGSFTINSLDHQKSDRWSNSRWILREFKCKLISDGGRLLSGDWILGLSEGQQHRYEDNQAEDHSAVPEVGAQRSQLQQPDECAPVLWAKGSGDRGAEVKAVHTFCL